MGSMSWQTVVIFALLVAVVLLAPRLGVDPTTAGVLTTLGAGFLVNKEKALPQPTTTVINNPSPPAPPAPVEKPAEPTEETPS